MALRASNQGLVKSIERTGCAKWSVKAREALFGACSINPDVFGLCLRGMECLGVGMASNGREKQVVIQVFARVIFFLRLRSGNQALFSFF